MKLHSATLLTSHKALPLLSVAVLLLLTVSTQLSAGKFSYRSPAAANPGSPPASTALTVLWHAGNFRYLDAVPGQNNLIEYVNDDTKLAHPSNGGYGMVSTDRKTKFNEFLDALFVAIDDSLVDGSTGDWCGVKNKAATAGYTINRFYDNESGRWFIFGKDATQFGQAYFFINPFAKRNIVIEVPHEPDDLDTDVQGARIFKALAARALIINKNRRYSDPDLSDCNANGSTYRQSDVAHETANTFHLLHVRYTSMDPTTKFVQLHGFLLGTGDRKAVIGDGTKNDHPADSVSNRFANYLRREGPDGDIASCQEAAGDPSPAYCGETNVQGRYTNAPGGDACHNSTTSYSGRFLHIEQAATMRDDYKEVNGWYWGDVLEALAATWPDCDMNNGATDCTLGPQQTQYSTWTCP